MAPGVCVYVCAHSFKTQALSLLSALHLWRAKRNVTLLFPQGATTPITGGRRQSPAAEGDCNRSQSVY